jgi:hypothetical protein
VVSDKLVNKDNLVVDGYSVSVGLNKQLIFGVVFDVAEPLDVRRWLVLVVLDFLFPRS